VRRRLLALGGVLEHRSSWKLGRARLQRLELVDSRHGLGVERQELVDLARLHTGRSVAALDGIGWSRIRRMSSIGASYHGGSRPAILDFRPRRLGAAAHAPMALGARSQSERLADFGPVRAAASQPCSDW